MRLTPAEIDVFDDWRNFRQEEFYAPEIDGFESVISEPITIENQPLIFETIRQTEEPPQTIANEIADVVISSEIAEVKNDSMIKAPSHYEYDYWGYYRNEDIPGFYDASVSSDVYFGNQYDPFYTPEPIYFIEPIEQPPFYIEQPPVIDVVANVAPQVQVQINQSGNLASKYAGKFAEMTANLQAIDADLASGRTNGEQAQNALSAFHNGWQSYKFSAPEKERGFLYQVEVESFKNVWDALQSRISAAIEQNRQATPQQATQTNANTNSQVVVSSNSNATQTTQTPVNNTSVQTTTTNQPTADNADATEKLIFGIPENYVYIGGALLAAAVLFGGRD